MNYGQGIADLLLHKGLSMKTLTTFVLLASTAVASEHQNWVVRKAETRSLKHTPLKDYDGNLSRSRKLVDGFVSEIESKVDYLLFYHQHPNSYGIRGPLDSFVYAVRSMRSERQRMERATSDATFFNAAKQVVKNASLAKKYYVAIDVYVK